MRKSLLRIMQRTEGDAFNAWADWAAERAQHRAKVAKCLTKLSQQVRLPPCRMARESAQLAC